MSIVDLGAGSALLPQVSRSAVASGGGNRQFGDARTGSPTLPAGETNTMTTDYIPFNRPYATGNELVYAAEAQRNFHLSCGGSFTRRCHQWIEQRIGPVKAPLMNS